MKTIMKTIDMVKASSSEENPNKGWYLFEEISTGKKEMYHANHNASMIAAAIDKPELGFKVILIEESAESVNKAFEETHATWTVNEKNELGL